MAKMWAGRTSGEVSSIADDFNSSIHFDCKLYQQDITGSMAHAAMLGECGIIDKSESEKIIAGLKAIRADLASGALTIDPDAEDIHTFVEGELTARIGDAGKRLHTARSRNDQVALDVRLTLRKDCAAVQAQLKDFVKVLCRKAERYAATVMPGYTHMQRAQPITFGHHLMAYAEMLLRDLSRLEDALRRMDVMPLGSGALAGTTYPLDRQLTAKLLGFSQVSQNSLDGVSDRDFCAEIAFAVSLAMVHLSRLCEEIVLWCSWEYKFIELDDAFSTGSSIMPQKKNPDIAELIRGKSGRVFGDLMALLSMMKGLPLAYNKDMQEDKEAFFDAYDTLCKCLPTFTEMLRTTTFRADVMRRSAGLGFTNATDLADYLVGKGVPFRDAHHVSGSLVGKCVHEGRALEDLSLEELRAAHPAFDEDVYQAISLEACVERRSLQGGPAPQAVSASIERLDRWLDAHADGAEA